MMISMREYLDEDRSTLISILKRNVPKYFAESDVCDFEEYLSNKTWDKHYVYLSVDGGIIGCAGFYLKSPGIIGLTYMFFEPLQVGTGAIRQELKKYFDLAVAQLCPRGKHALVLNTTPRVAKLMRRFGFVATDVVKDGYAKGYDTVYMERQCLTSGSAVARRVDRQ